MILPLAVPLAVLLAWATVRPFVVLAMLLSYVRAVGGDPTLTRKVLVKP